MKKRSFYTKNAMPEQPTRKYIIVENPLPVPAAAEYQVRAWNKPAFGPLEKSYRRNEKRKLISVRRAAGNDTGKAIMYFYNSAIPSRSETEQAEFNMLCEYLWWQNTGTQFSQDFGKALASRGSVRPMRWFKHPPKGTGTYPWMEVNLLLDWAAESGKEFTYDQWLALPVNHWEVDDLLSSVD